MRLRTVLAGCLLLCGCASLKNDQTVCPEYRDLRCATPEVCTFDKVRGCRVCHCDVPMDNSGSPDKPALPP